MNAPVHPAEFRTDDGSTPAERYARLQDPTYDDLAYLPGDGKKSLWARLKHTRRFLKDTLGLMQEKHRKYGPVWVNHNLMGAGVQIIGPEANEMVLMNCDRIFSS